MTAITVSNDDNGVIISPDKTTEANSGQSPATHANPVQTKGTTGCTIALRSRRHHPHLR